MAKDRKEKGTGDFFDSDDTIYNSGQALNAKRKRVDKECVVCGDLMLNVYESKECCSATCRSRKRRNP